MQSTLVINIPSGAESPLTQALAFISYELNISDNQLCLNYKLNRTTLRNIRKGINPVRHLEYYFVQFLSVLQDRCEAAMNLDLHARLVNILIFITNLILTLFGVRKIKK